MIGAFIFLLAVAIVIPLFLKISEDSRSAQFAEDAQIRLSFAADALMRTGGSPADWNTTTVQSIGLADENGRINKTKIRYMMELGPSEFRTLTGLQGLHFNISFYADGFPAMTGEADSPAAYFYAENNTMFTAINGSGLVWDLYYGGAGLPETGDAANVYSGSKTGTFDAMVANSTLYKTIIIEDPELTQGQVNVEGLKNFVRTGGILIFEGDADLLASGFGMSSTSGAVVTGIVRDTNFIDAPEGDTVNFYDGGWYFYNTTSDGNLQIMVENSVSGGASMGRWNYGVGRIIYIADIHGFAGGRSLIEITRFAGTRAEFSSAALQTAFVNARAVVYNTDLNSMGKAIMAVGI
jgi:hypothetical protein